MKIKFTAEQYVDDVLNGDVIACRWVKLACERHRRDLENGHERGLWFDEQAAQVAIAFFSILRHWKGEWAGKTIELEPCQQFWLWSLFGWKTEEGSRRFRTGYLEIARKNTKTTFAAGVGLYLAFVEGEAGAEVYSAAVKRDQAKISHRDATEMVKRSPELSKMISIYRDNLHIPNSGSKFEPLASDYNSLDGLNIHGVIADELHAWRGNGLWGVLKTATGSREQPLMLAITTAGVDQYGICYQQRAYVTQVLKGIVEDDSYWGMIYTLDTKQDWPELQVVGDGEADESGEFEDDWQDESTWIKANPMLGISKKWRAIRSDALEASNKPAELNNFLRWHLNIWTSALTRWVSPIHWAACGETAVPEVLLNGRTCYAGLDLAQIYDLAALVLVFPPEEEDEPYKIICRFWLPEDNMGDRVKRDRVPYDVWARQGFITLTPGNVIDYDFIEVETLAMAETFNIVELGYDRYSAPQIIQNLQSELGDDWVVPIGQGFVSMSPPMKELGRMIASQQLAHGNNPVLTWMADNLVARTDPAGNIKPDKEKSREKIDGMVSLIMGIDRATRHGGVSKYETEELLIL